MRPPDPVLKREASTCLRKLKEDHECGHKSAMEWHANAKLVRGGRQLFEHMAHVHCAIENQNEVYDSPVDDVCTSLRLFIRAWERSPTAFNLPLKPPKFIAIVNLSGERSILTSNEPYMFLSLVHSVPGTTADEDGGATSVSLALKRMIAYRDAHPAMSLLLVYSLPYQMGLTHLHWDLRTIQRLPNDVVVDGQQWFSLIESTHASWPRPAIQTSAHESEHQTNVLTHMAKEMEANYRCQNLDVVPGDEVGSVEEGASTSSRERTLVEICNRLRVERAALQRDHEAHIIALKQKQVEDVHKARTVQEVAYARERELEAKHLRAAETAMAMVKERQCEIDACKQQVADARGELATCGEEWERERKKLQARIVAAEQAASASARQLNDAAALRTAEMQAHTRRHVETVDNVEKRLAATQLAAQQARAECEGSAARLEELRVLMDAQLAAKEDLVQEWKAARRAIRLLRSFLTLAGLRYRASRDRCATLDEEVAECQGRCRVHELAAGAQQARLEMAIARALVAEATAEDRVLAHRATGEDGNGDEETLTCPEAEHEESAVTARDQSTETLPISTRADFELGELSMAHAKLQDEHAETVALVAELQARLNQHETTPRVASSTSIMPTTQIPDAAIDAAMEVVRSQLGVLENMARDASRHRNAAMNAHAHIESLQSMLAYAPVAMPPPAFAYHPHYPHHSHHQQQAHLCDGYYNPAGSFHPSMARPHSDS